MSFLSGGDDGLASRIAVGSNEIMYKNIGVVCSKC